MDHNLAFACVGYGAMRVLRAHDFQEMPFEMPASRILQQEDPVEFCIEAMRHDHPDWVEKITRSTRRGILQRLESEARRQSAPIC